MFEWARFQFVSIDWYPQPGNEITINRHPRISVFILVQACLVCLWPATAHAEDIQSTALSAIKEKTASSSLTVAGMVLRAPELKVRVTGLENRVAAFPEADAAAVSFAAIKANLAELDTRINQLDPDRLYLVPIHKWLIRPISALCENFYPRNINHMPAGKIFESLDLDLICLFLDGHYLNFDKESKQ
jgi:hypothetical protein